jgi:hypothetical protein
MDKKCRMGHDHFTINDREVSGEDGWTILEVAREHGIKATP